MPKKLIYIRYKELTLKPDTLQMIEQADGILQEYMAQGYIMTLRQLYYQFVSRDLFANVEANYKKLINVVSNGRIAGLLPWNALEDTAREWNEVWSNESRAQAISFTPKFFKVDFWKFQKHYVEVMVEKDALISVVERPCKAFRVPYMGCKGYMSQTHIWNAGERFRKATQSYGPKGKGRKGILIHLGDHDPSGIDMTRDNAERLEMFSRYTDVEVRRIALNMDQVRQYNPPPNPAKNTDTRFADYMKKYGDESWELDALEPSVIDALITNAIRPLINKTQWNADTAREEANQSYLENFNTYYGEIEEFMNKSFDLESPQELDPKDDGDAEDDNGEDDDGEA